MLFCPYCFEEFKEKPKPPEEGKKTAEIPARAPLQEKKAEENAEERPVKAAGQQGKIDCPGCKKTVDADMLFCPYCFEEFKEKPKPPGEGKKTASPITEKPSRQQSKEIKEDFFTSNEDQGMLIDGRYSIIEPFHFTCSRAIYKVEDVSEPDTYYSLREFLIQGEDLAQKEEIAEKFEETAEHFVNISHPSLSRIIDYFCEENYLYLVFDYIEGKNVAQFLHDFHKRTNQGMPEGLIVQWALTICELFEYLHQLNPEPLYCIDFKPSLLIMNAKYDRIVYINLGLPYILDVTGVLESDGSVCLKEMKDDYKSPRRDLWCLGAILYFFLTGIDIQRDEKLEIKPIQSIRPDLSPPFIEMMRKLLGQGGISDYKDVKSVKKDFGESCKPRPISSYDFYYEYCEIDYINFNWSSPFGNNNRSNSLGPGPRHPMKQDWHANMKAGTLAYLLPFENYLISAFSDGEFFMFETGKNTPEWRFNLKESINPPAIFDGIIFLSSASSQEMCAIKIGKASPFWSLPLENMAMSSPCVKEDMAYQVTYDGTILAVETEEGEVFWREPLDARILSVPLLEGQNLYINALNGIVYSINLDDRDFNWQFDTEGTLSTTPTLIDTNLFVCNNEGFLFCLDADKGDLRWEFDLKSSVAQPVSGANNMIFTVTQKGILYCFDPEDGDTKWKVNLGQSGDYPYALTNNKLFTIMPDNRIFCIDAFSGKLVDKTRVEGRIISSPLVFKGALYVVTGSGALVCYR